MWGEARDPASTLRPYAYDASGPTSPSRTAPYCRSRRGLRDRSAAAYLVVAITAFAQTYGNLAIGKNDAVQRTGGMTTTPRKPPAQTSTGRHDGGWRRLTVAVIAVVVVTTGASLAMLSRQSNAPSATVDGTPTRSVQQSPVPVVIPSLDPRQHTTTPPVGLSPVSQPAISSASSVTPRPKTLSTPTHSDWVNVTGLGFPEIATCANGPLCLLHTRMVAAPATTRASPYLSQAGYPGCTHDPAIAIEMAFTFDQHPTGAAAVEAYISTSTNYSPFKRTQSKWVPWLGRV